VAWSKPTEQKVDNIVLANVSKEPHLMADESLLYKKSAPNSPAKAL